MNKARSTLFIIASLILSIVWIKIPSLQPFTLQLISALALVFVLLHKAEKKKPHQLLPNQDSLQISLLIAVSIIIIMNTGGAGSAYFSIVYVVLFLVVFTTEALVATSATIGIMLSIYMLDTNVGFGAVVQLLSLPLVSCTFLVAKYQYLELHLQTQRAESDEQQIKKIEKAEVALERFLEAFVAPKIRLLENETNNQEITPSVLKNQLSLLESEIKKVLDTIRLRSK